MGRLLLLITTGIASIGSCPLPCGAQDPEPAANPHREIADRVILAGGQVELRTPDDQTVKARKPSELPEGKFVLIGIDFGGQSRVTDAEIGNLGQLPELAEVNLSYTRISDEGLKSLDPLPGITRLYLSETQITDKAFQRIANHQNLVSLDLSGTKITDKPLEELKKLPKLSRLFLGRTRITGDSLSVLAELPELSVLHLAGNEMPAAELASLKQLPDLEELSLTTTNEGLAKLAELPKLKILTVHGRGISDEGMPALAKLANLEQLRLSQTGVSERGAKLIQDSLKKCRIMAHPISRQSAFLMATLPGQRPVLRWQPGNAKTAWPGLVPRPAKLPGISRWQLETREPRSEIRSVKFSPNGQQIACGTAAGLVRIYDADQLTLLQLIPAHAGGVNAVDWSPDGTRLASAGTDGTVRIWSQEGQSQHVLKGHRSNVMTVAWSPDGQWLASGGWDNSVRLWKADGSSSQELKGHSNAVFSLAWNPEGNQIASGSEDATIRIWDLNGKELHVMKGHASNVVSLAWSSRGSRLASGSWDQTIRFWNPNTGRGGPVLEGHTYRVFALEWHPEGSVLASAGDRTLRLWTLDGTPVRTVKTEDDHILSLSWKHDGNEIVTGTRNSSILRANKLSDKTERAIGETHGGGVSQLAWHPSGDRIAAGCWDHKIRLVTEDGRAGAILSGHTYNVRALGWSPDGERLASGGDSLLRLWNRHGIPLATLKEHANGIQSLAWSPDGNGLATVSDDATARIWSADGKVEKIINLEQRARRVAWSPDGRKLATASENQARIWNRDGTPGPELADPPASLVTLVWNHATNQIAAGGWSREFQLWDAEGTRGTAQTQVRGILDIAIHPKGDRVAMGLFGNKAVLTEADGSQGRVFDAHAGPVNAVAWHPQGHAFVTGAYDNTLRFWDAETLQPQSSVLYFRDGGVATCTAAGQLVHGDLSSLEPELVYVIETQDGQRRMLTPSEFEKQFHESQASAPQLGG